MKKYPIKHVGIFTLDEVFAHIGEDWHIFTVDGNDYRVLMATRRYINLQKQPWCAACGLKGDHFILEIDPKNPLPKFKDPRFNMYSAKGTMMTIDHILPRSLGGKDNMENRQVMCCNCNRSKGANPNWIFKSPQCELVRKDRDKLFMW